MIVVKSRIEHGGFSGRLAHTGWQAQVKCEKNTIQRVINLQKDIEIAALHG